MVENPAGKPIAVLERSIRQDIPRLEGKRAGYVEGLCVVLEFRRYGIARELLRTSLNWARKNQCVAFATDRDRRPQATRVNRCVCVRQMRREGKSNVCRVFCRMICRRPRGARR
jgi:GNAT superfamily N-acetyltransferase